MPYKDRERRLQCQRECYHRHKRKASNLKRRKAYKNKVVRENLQFLEGLKALGCQLCGYKKCPNAIDFHHIDESTKSFGISVGVQQKHVSRATLEAELKKCIRVCANCHREIHAGYMGI